MQNKNQRIIEKEFQKALAIEYVKTFCAFAQPSDIKPNGLINDRDTMPKVTLIIKFEDRQLRIEKTEYTEVFLREG